MAHKFGFWINKLFFASFDSIFDLQRQIALLVWIVKVFRT